MPDLVGLTSLIQRVGAGNQPTGAGVAVGQVEGDADGTPGPPFVTYPDHSNPDFAGKTFTLMSGAQQGTSAHATLVGQNLYGLNAIAPGITQIYAYEVNSWLQSAYLFFGSPPAFPPLPPPAGLKIFNHSWIGTTGSLAFDNEILRRTDFAGDRDDVLNVHAVNNAGFGPQQPLMDYSFNGIAVGLLSGSHVFGAVTAGFDGPGRQKPEIVAPNGFTSFATPVVSAAAALLYQIAQTAPGLASNPNAKRSEVIKAVLLAGGNHGANGAHAWSNNPGTSGANRGLTTTPLDPVYGVDLVNVDRSHFIFTGLEQNGVRSVPLTSNASARGWDFASSAASSTLYYRFQILHALDNLSVAATWHRSVATDFMSYTLADYDLLLERVDAANQAQSLLGNAGLPYFGGGNVVSQSAVDNIEHLFISNLAPGTYVIELRRNNDGVPGTRDVALAWLARRLGDINGDGVVNVDDLLAVIIHWGPCPAPPAACPGDANHDGTVNVDDLLMVITNWG